LCVFWKLTADQGLLFDWITGSSQVITFGEMEGVRSKAKFQRKLTPGTFLTFLPTYSLSFEIPRNLTSNQYQF